MISIDEVIIVEGRYDKNTLSQIVDATIIETSGFGVFSDREKLDLIRRMAEARGIIILTDSDGAGFVIRNHLKGAIDSSRVKHAYIPDIEGKEKRKSSPSKEGKLGVEGMSGDVLKNALIRAGATVLEQRTAETREKITKADMYQFGLSGKADSLRLRRQLLKRLSLPEKLSANAFLDVLNAIMERDEFISLAAGVLSDPQA